MKTRFKYIHFVEVTGVNPNKWLCYNNRTQDRLGMVEWFKDWKQYEFSAADYACFTACCLRDIANFMDALKEKR